MNKKYYLILIILAAISAYAIPYINALAIDYKLSVPIPGESGIMPEPPQYILMLFRFGLTIAGLLALGMIIFGAIQYTTSAGNVSRQQDAKDRITSAIYGIILLVGATLILTTINPDLALLKWEKPAPIDIKSESIEWGEAYKKILANYQAKLKALEEERARIEQEKKITNADSKEAAAILAAAEKNPNTSPKDLLSLRIKNEEKTIADNKKIVERTNKDLEITQTRLTKIKIELLGPLIKAARNQITNKDIITSLNITLENWQKNSFVTEPPFIKTSAAKVAILAGREEIWLVMDEIGTVDALITAYGGVQKTQESRNFLETRLKEEERSLTDSQLRLIKYQNELKALNVQSQPQQQIKEF